jgi:hypothetical protein
MGGIGEMDSLLDVDNLVAGSGAPAGARGSTHDINKAYSKVTIACQDDSGKVFATAAAAFTTIEVSSQLNQSVVITKAGTKLTITAFSAASDPIIEAKQHKKKRRYVVANSGPIETVKVDGAVVYDVPGGTLIGTAAGTILYSSVVIT